MTSNKPVTLMEASTNLRNVWVSIVSQLVYPPCEKVLTWLTKILRAVAD